MQYFKQYGATITPEMNYGVPEILGANPYKLGMGDGSVFFHDKYGPEPDPALFQNLLNNQNTFKLDPRTLTIPDPHPNFKKQPGYNPTMLPGFIDGGIMRGYFGVT